MGKKESTFIQCYFSDPQQSGMQHLLPLRHGSISLSLEQQWPCEKKKSLARERHTFSRSESADCCVCYSV